MVIRARFNFAKFTRFCLVGGCGFVVDYGLAQTAISGGLDPFTARLLSITVAMAVTWRLNRAITFRAGRSRQGREGLRYLAVAAGAASLNHAVYSALLIGFADIALVLAIAMSTALSMIVSYTGFSRFAFKTTEK